MHVIHDTALQAEAAENLCKEEIDGSKEIEELLLRQRQEMETMKNQQDQLLKELELIQDGKPALESQLREAYCSEKELEDRFIQAVNLLKTFKETRDELRMEYDSAIRKVNKYRALQTEDPLGISPEHFFGISFSDIIEATQNFKPSHKIGEGRYGSVFKGMLCHIKVAIKMLPSSGSQSDSEFKNEVIFSESCQQDFPVSFNNVNDVFLFETVIILCGLGLIENMKLCTLQALLQKAVSISKCGDIILIVAFFST